MLAYILIFFLLFFSKNKRSNNICFVILLIFTVMRFDVGWDYRWYYILATKDEFVNLSFFVTKDEILNFIASNNWDFVSWNYYRIEMINKIFYKLIWFLKISPQFIIVIYGFFTLFFIKKGLDNEKIYTNNTWLFYFCFPVMWFSHISIMRQGLAVSIIFYSYKYIKNREFLKYFIFVMIASFIHKSSGIMIILYFLYNLNFIINRWIYLLSLIVAPIIKYIVFYIMTNLNILILAKYKHYILNKAGGGGTKIYWIMLVLYILILIGIFVDKNLYKKYKFLITIVLLGLYIYISLISFGHAGPRLAAYFLIFLLYLIPWIENILKKLKLSKNILSFSLLVIMLLTLYIDINISLKSQFVPYNIYLNKSKEINLTEKWRDEK